MNAKLVRLLGPDQMVYPHQLDTCFPRIVEKMVDLWGTPQLERYFSELMLDSRGDREGFAPAVLFEIFALSNYYSAQKPTRPRSIDTWGEVADLQRIERRVDTPESP